jgi:hypothetical protein
MVLAALVVGCLVSIPVYAEAPTVAIRGVVKDDAGEAVEGATLRLAGNEWNQLPPFRIQRFVGGPVKSDSNGAFLFEVQPYGSYTVVGERGDAVGFASASHGRTDTDLKVTLLHPAAECSGKVLDEAGVPVAGAVAAQHNDSIDPRLLAGSGLGFATVTDADGVFRRARTFGKGRHLLITADGYTPLLASVSEAQADDRVFVMKRGLRLSGRVLSVPTHEAVAGVAVVCVPFTRFGVTFAETDSEGRFEFADLIPGHARLAVQGPVWVLAGQPPEIDLKDMTPADGVQVYVVRTGAVEGRIVDAVTGREIEAASVEIAYRRSNITGPDGVYRVVGIPPGTHYYNYSTPPGFVRCTNASTPRVEVRSGETTKVDIAACSAPPIVGRIVDERGTPVEGAWVSARREGGPIRGAETAPDGTFTVYGYEPGDEIEILARKDGYVSTTEYGIRVTRTGLKDPTLVLPTGGTVRGRILDSTGKPFPGVTAYIEQHDYLGMTPQARSDSEGIFELHSIEPGLRVVKAWRIVYGQDDLRAEAEVEVIAGEASRVELRLPAVEQNTLSGWVRDEVGRPVASVTVGAWASFQNVSAAVPMTLTDSDGHFDLPYYGVGPCRATANVDGYSILQDHQPIGDGQVLLELKRQRVIEGRVVSAATGEPIPQFSMVLGTDNNPGDWAFAKRYYEADGTFVIPLHEKGASSVFHITVRTPDGAEATEVVTMPQDAPTEEIVLRVR